MCLATADGETSPTTDMCLLSSPSQSNIIATSIAVWDKGGDRHACSLKKQAT